MRETCYDKLILFKKKYPFSVTWFRLKKHCQVMDKHLNDNERIEFVFAGQLDNDALSFFNTGILVLTNERLCVCQNRLIIGYKFSSVTPDLYNDMQVDSGLIWGTVCIDTIKEKIYVSNVQKSSLPEIETQVTKFMQEAKKKYPQREDNK